MLNTENLKKSLSNGATLSIVSVGFDMKCKHVITKSKLSYDETDQQYYVINGGFKILCTDLSGLHFDTPLNRKLLKQEIELLN